MLKNKESKLPFHYGYIIVFCCCLLMGIDVGISMSCAGIFYQPVSDSLGVPVGKFGLYMSFNFFASSVCLSFAGKLMEKYSARMLLTLNSAVLGFCLVAMGFFNAVWQFYIAGCLIGVTLAFLLYLSFPTLLNRWFKTQVGFFIGICSAASGIGGIILNPIGAALITNYGWRAAYGIFGLAILCIVTPLIGWLLRDRPKDMNLLPFGEAGSARAEQKTPEGVEYSKAVKMPVFYALIVFAFLLMAVSTLNLFIPNYVMSLDFSLAQASLAASAVMAGVTVGKVALGFINDKSCLMGVGATVICGASGIILLLGGNMGIMAILGGAFLFGWAYAGVTVQTPMLVRSVFGNRNYARIYSVVSIALAAGGAITAGGWGLLADITSSSFIFILGIILLFALGLIGMYALSTRKKILELSVPDTTD